MNENFKNAFTFTKGERIAIITIATIILSIIAANYFIIRHPPDNNESFHNLDSILALHDKAIEEMKAKELAKETERKNKYRAYQNKKKTDFHQKPKEYQKPKNQESGLKKNQGDKKNTETIIINPNLSDSLELLKLPNIGPSFAHRILEYRKRLGGFCNASQLLEVYGMDSARYNTILPYIIIDSFPLSKIKVNYDDFKTILRHPYIEYEDVKKIINYRESKGLITNMDIYCKVIGKEVHPYLKEYLDFE